MGNGKGMGLTIISAVGGARCRRRCLAAASGRAGGRASRRGRDELRRHLSHEDRNEDEEEEGDEESSPRSPSCQCQVGEDGHRRAAGGAVRITYCAHSDYMMMAIVLERAAVLPSVILSCIVTQLAAGHRLYCRTIALWARRMRITNTSSSGIAGGRGFPPAVSL